MLGDPCHATRWFVTHVAFGITRCISRDMNDLFVHVTRTKCCIRRGVTRYLLQRLVTHVIHPLMHHLVHVTCTNKSHSMALQHAAARVTAVTWYVCRVWRMSRTVSLQHTATHCNTLQHTATHCNTRTLISGRILLQHTAMLAPSYCMHSVLQ